MRRHCKNSLVRAHWRIRSGVWNPRGQFCISFTPKPKTETVDETTCAAWLSFCGAGQSHLIIFLWKSLSSIKKISSNTIMIMFPPMKWFKRTPSQIGRNIELCHPPKVLDKVKENFWITKKVVRDLPMWFKSDSLGKFVYVTISCQGWPGELSRCRYVQDIETFLWTRKRSKETLIKSGSLAVLVIIISKRLETLLSACFYVL